MLELRESLRLDGERASYHLERPLGEGGFGQAWAARADDGTGVVIKQLRIQRMDDWKSLELFEREARVLASLSHPNIPRHLELFAHDGHAAHPVGALADLEQGCLISIYVRVEGRSLEEHVASGAVMTGPDLVRLLDRLLAVLAYLHGLQPPVVHRDLKPANVIVDAQGEPHLVDFGAIKNHMRDGSTSVGTFGYFPMEQMMGQSQPPSDLYALGMTALVTATGLRPDQMLTDPDTGKVDVPRVAPHLPPAVATVVGRMLEPAIGRRIGSATEARALLANPTAALAVRPTAALEHPKAASLKRLSNLAIGGGGASAAVLYFVLFDSFSETALVQVSGLWIAPLVFGLALRGALAQRTKHPVSVAIGITGASLLALIVFFIAIFPAL